MYIKLWPRGALPVSPNKRTLTLFGALGFHLGYIIEESEE